MSKVHVCNVVVCNNPAPFLDNLQFEITFDCIETLSDDLQWKIIYVGSAETEDYDQTLEQVSVGPVYEGRHRFLFEATPPDTEKLPRKAEDVIGLTLIMLTCSYRTKEFIRIGYYVNVQYTEKELEDNPPEQPNFSKMQREIMADKSRVTKFPIKWDDAPNFNHFISDNQVRKKPRKDIIDLESKSPKKKLKLKSKNNDIIELDVTSPTKNGPDSSKKSLNFGQEDKKDSNDDKVSDIPEEEVDEEEEKKKFLSSFLVRDEGDVVKEAPKVDEVSKSEEMSKDKETPISKEVLKEKEPDDNIEIVDDEPMIIVDSGSKDTSVPATITDTTHENNNKENNTPLSGA